MHPGLRAAEEKMRAAEVPEPARATFARLFQRLVDGDRGVMHGDELEPVHDLPTLEDLPAGGGDLDRAVVIKLNGGLGTSMGLSSPKSLIEVKPGVTFLDAIVHQVLALRERCRVRLPLVLLNSFSTRDATLDALRAHPRIADQDVPLDFLQSREPKLRADDLTPVDWPDEPRLEWTPPGHGDLYPSLHGSGMLGALLERGYEYAFASNSDNLGAVVEPRILAWLCERELPFAMEVVEGTDADRKGGHIARRGGRLMLRETAQAPHDDDSFGDHGRWRHYNSNNLWIHLPTLARLLDERGGTLDLPLIVNRKNVDPADSSSPAVIQLETAMGAAIGAIDGAAAIRVPRTRFAPVKTTDDLLAVRSDAYVLREDDWHAEPAPERAAADPPVIQLDPRFYKRLADFERRFPDGPPSLVQATRLTVRGDVTFGAGSVVCGDAEVSA